MKKIDVAVIGASGYAGLELLRLLLGHPGVRISAVTSEQSAGQPVRQVFPALQTEEIPPYESLNLEAIGQKADFFFVALPAGSALEPVAQLVRMGKKVVDLSADYRLQDPRQYQDWYHHIHPDPALLQRAVYGLSEIHREEIRQSSLVANPGCYPVSVILALYPILKEGLADLTRPLLVDAKSGVSGAGRSPTLTSHFSEVSEGIVPYGLGGHRHTPEMIQELSALTGGTVRLTFTPHLIPINRGILSTIYLDQTREVQTQDLVTLYRACYKDEPFVKVLGEDQAPNPHHVRGTNACHIGIVSIPGSPVIVIFSAIDNLMKGAAGQAIQNMNLMMGWDETWGLKTHGLFP